MFKKFLGELTSQRDGPWLTPVMLSGVVGGVAMILLAFERPLGFGEGVSTTLQAIVGAALLSGLLNARQWNMTSEGKDAPIAPTKPKETE